MKANIKQSISNQGMTLPEVILASFMLTAFTGVFIIVMEFTNTFYDFTKQETEGANGVLIDHHELKMAMDSWVSILSQPGYTKETIKNFKCKYPPNPPNRIWDLPGIEDRDIPDGYQICLYPTQLEESIENKKAGIYILYAIPDKISKGALPVRRIFCRPKTFC